MRQFVRNINYALDNWRVQVLRYRRLIVCCGRYYRENLILSTTIPCKVRATTSTPQGIFIRKGKIMEFNETGKEIYTVPKYNNFFVYFLLKNNDVVYVGQTKNGLLRPLSHKDKEYEQIINYLRSNQNEIYN